MAKYTYLLTITDNENDEDVGIIEALSKDSLEEQLHKIPIMIENYEEKKEEIDEEDLLDEGEDFVLE